MTHAHFDALKGDERNKTLVFALLGKTVTFLKQDISILRWKLREQQTISETVHSVQKSRL
jgi:hypothetical protein